MRLDLVFRCGAAYLSAMGCAATEDKERCEEAKLVDVLRAAADGQLEELELVSAHLPTRINRARAEKALCTALSGLNCVTAAPSGMDSAAFRC